VTLHTDKKIADLPPKTSIKKTPIVGVGASAGGLEALKQLFTHLPKAQDIAFVIVSHMDPAHKSLLVEIIARFTDLNVVEITHQMPIAPNHVYIIPPNKDLTIADGILLLQPPAEPHGLRLPIDTFFASLAEDQQECSSCIILSGTGSDGTQGIKAIKSLGGFAIAQDPKEAQFESMPSSAIATDVVDHVLKAADMGEVLSRYFKHACIRGFFGNGRLTHPDELAEYTDILNMVKEQIGHNFHGYKNNTLERRIKRRISVLHLENIKAYAAHLRTHPDEINELFKDLLIGVTSFFRDPESWAVLEKKCFEKLDDDKQELRIWIPGCSTGEEAYSMAMLLEGFMQRQGKQLKYQIFATDIDTRALAHARQGVYPESISHNLSSEQLNTFFKKEGAYYRVLPELRQNIVFCEQNLISDPPFSNIDLISCRNLFIYFQPQTQTSILETFNFSLNQFGYLLLGSSETIGHHSAQFQTISKKWRLYKKLNSYKPSMLNLSARGRNLGVVKHIEVARRPSIMPNLNVNEIARDALLGEYVPASVLVNDKYEVLYHFGDTVDFLRYPTGKSTNDLFALLREGLATRVRSAAFKALREKVSVRVDNAKVKRNGAEVDISFRVKPLAGIAGGEDLILISFENQAAEQHAAINQADVPMDDLPLVKQLEYELSVLYEELENNVQAMETANEELKTANEEAMSSNEELQSSNEELETSKEELQSFNEELNTVNAELQEKIYALETAHNDLSNLISSAKNPAVFLDFESKIKFFTPSSDHLFNIIASDIGRPLSHIVSKFSDPDLVNEISRVIQTGESFKSEVKTNEGQWFNRRILPYRALDGAIAGTVIRFDDITDIKNSLEDLRQSESKYRQLFENMLNGFALHEMIFDDAGKPTDYRFLEINKAFEQITNLTSEDVIGRRVTAIIPGIENDSADWIGKYGQVVLTGKPLQFEQYSEVMDKYVSVLAYATSPTTFAVLFEDISERKMADEKMAEKERLFRNTFEQAAVGMAHVSPDGSWLRVNQRLSNMLGYLPEDLLQMTFQEITHPDDLGSDLKQVNEILTGKIERYAMKKRYIVKDGSTLWVNLTVSLVRDNEGNPDYFISVVEDIHERKMAEERLRQSEYELRMAQERAHIGNWTYDLSGQFTWSDELYHIYGVSKQSFTPSEASYEELIHPEDRHLIQKWMESCLAGHKTKPLIFRAIHPEDGTIRTILRHGNLQTDDKGNPCCIKGTSHDITEQKELEEQFQQAQKMEALGTLVGGIAHDFKNILAGITGNLYLAKQHVKDVPEAAQNLEVVESLSYSAAELIKQLLTFARKDRVVMKPLPLVPFLKETLKLLRPSIAENIDINTDISDEMFIINGDATQLQQVLFNMVNNARDAVEDIKAPTINFSLKKVRADDGLRNKLPEATHDAYVLLSVSDNGKGIPAADIEHIFEPFYTTKEQGKGTGLGLAMVFGAVKRHQGFIDTQSSQEKGTTFHIYLPLIKNVMPELPGASGEVVDGHGETILVVDDEATVLGIGAEILSSLGYKVLTANNGLEATQVFAEHQDTIKLIIMDVVMPVMGGIQAAEKIRETNPDAKFLFCTGYQKDDASNHKPKVKGARFISKPYEVAALSQMIQEMLTATKA